MLRHRRALAASSRCIIPKDICFKLQLSKPVLENVADTDNSNELVAILYRHMANAQLGHQLHYISDAVLR